MDDAIEVVRIEVGKLQLLPGDTLVIRCPEGWAPCQITQYAEYLRAQKTVPDGVKLLMLPAGAESGVLLPLPGFNHP